MLPIHFAPLQGYTDAAYRNAHCAAFGGIEAYYTPFWRIERGEIRRKDIADYSNDTTGRVIPQIIVRDAAEFCLLVEQLRQLGARHIDINMGCPFPMQTNKGRGAGLLERTKQVGEILKEVSHTSDIDFSIKMRLGNQSSEEFRALLPMLNETPLTHITVHPRIGKQQYKGAVDMDRFGEFLAQCSQSVIYNGDLTSVDDIKRIERDFPEVKGIMLGRGLLARPSLAAEYHSGEELEESALKRGIMDMHREIFAYYSATLQGEAQILSKIKAFWEYLEPTIGHKAHKAIHKAGNLLKYTAAVDGMRYENL